MNKIRVTGVPEHFNLPWHLAIEQGLFKTEALELEWTDEPGGTGAMCKSLRSNETDLAIILTEGVIKDIVQGNESKIIQQYVISPLIWGMHVNANSSISEVNDLETSTFAISRNGSGSHIMAYVLAEQQGWDVSKLCFEVVGGLEGARKAIPKKEADILLWEKFTTKPLVDSGEFKRVGELRTPWPCFVLAASGRMIKDHADQIKKIQKIINQKCAEFMVSSNSISLVAKRYGLEPMDVKNWFSQTFWAITPNISGEIINYVQETLIKVGVIKKMLTPEEILFEASK